MGDGKKDRNEPTEAEIRAHISRRLKEALPKVKEINEREKARATRQSVGRRSPAQSPPAWEARLTEQEMRSEEVLARVTTGDQEPRQIICGPIILGDFMPLLTQSEKR